MNCCVEFSTVPHSILFWWSFNTTHVISVQLNGMFSSVFTCLFFYEIHKYLAVIIEMKCVTVRCVVVVVFFSFFIPQLALAVHFSVNVLLISLKFVLIRVTVLIYARMITIKINEFFSDLFTAIECVICSINHHATRQQRIQSIASSNWFLSKLSSISFDTSQSQSAEYLSWLHKWNWNTNSNDSSP